MADRIVRIAEAFKQELSQIIREEIKDPRIPTLTSVVNVSVTKDLKYAKAYISIYASSEEKENAMKGLKSAAGFIRKEIGHRLNLRYNPELSFQLDESIEQGIYLTNLINKTIKDDIKQAHTDTTEE